MPSFSTDIRSLPNLITISRMVVVGVGVGFYFAGHVGTGLLIGIAGGLMDYLDGMVARRTGQVTYLGAILDQFSDRVVESLVFLMIITHPNGFHPIWFFAYLFRELWVTTIRRFVTTRQLDIKSSLLGKLKANFLTWSFLFWLMHLTELAPSFEPAILILASVGLYGGLLLGYLSGWQYTRQFIVAYDTMDPATGVEP